MGKISRDRAAFLPYTGGNPFGGFFISPECSDYGRPQSLQCCKE